MNDKRGNGRRQACHPKYRWERQVPLAEESGSIDPDHPISMAQKKAKVLLSPLSLTTNAFHSDEVPMSDSDLSPLTPLSVDLELHSDQQSDSGDLSQSQYWHRYAVKGYRLPGESEVALGGPQYPGMFNSLLLGTTSSMTEG